MKIRVLAFLTVLIAAASFGQFKVDPSVIPFVHAKQRALVIGAGDYIHLGKLEYSPSDATKFAEALTSGFRFSKDSIELLTDDKAPLTSKLILAKLDEMLADPMLDKGDLFIVYFSGHGIGMPSGDYLCAPDTKLEDVTKTGLNTQEVVSRLSAKKLRNVVVIADACRSGQENSFGLQLAELGRKMNYGILLGSAPGTKSYEMPRLRAGVFTHYLLRALSNQKIRTKSGALWLSHVGTSVKNSVLDFTRQQFGNSFQEPVVIADPTSDVLLANFAKSDGADQDDPAVSTSKRCDQLTALGLDALERDDMDVALDYLKQAFSLDPTNMYAAYYATIALTELNRPGESEKYCKSLIASDNAYFRSLGYIQSDSRTTSVPERIKAADVYWEESPKDPLHAIIIWARLRVFAPMSVTSAFMRKALPALEAHKRISAFFRAELAFSENKYEEALAAYAESTTYPNEDNLLSDDMANILRTPILRFLGRHMELRDWVLSRCASEEVPAQIWVMGAYQLKQIGYRDEAIAIVKKNIKRGELTDLQVTTVAETLGVVSLEHIDDFKKQVDLAPFSWRKKLVAAIIEGLKIRDAEVTSLAIEESNKFSEDETEVLALSYQIQDAVMQDAINYANASPTDFSEPYSMFRFMFFAYADKIGTDSEKWSHLCELGINQFRGPQAYRLLTHFNPDFRGETQLDATFLTLILQLAFAVEDNELAKFAAFHPSLVRPDKDDNAMLYYAHLYGQGKTEGLLAKLDELGPLSDTLAPIETALRLALTATKADKRKLVEFATTEHGDTEGLVLSKGIAGLALLKLGDKENALYCLKLFSQYRPTMVQSLTFACASACADLYREKGEKDSATALIFSTTQYALPVPGTKRMSFSGSPSLAQYKGRYQASCTWISDEMYQEERPDHLRASVLAAIGEGKIDLIVDANGGVTGTLAVTKGERMTLSGKVDALGNFDGKAISPTTNYQLEAKLVPASFHGSEAFKSSPAGQAMFLTHSKTRVMSQWFWDAKSIKFTPK